MTDHSAKTRLLCLVEILTMYSDEFNIMTTSEIVDKLTEYGFSVQKRTVLSDIKAINETSQKIIGVSKPKKGFYLAKSYSQYAIHLILEAVFSSDSLSESDMEFVKNYLKGNTCLPTLNLILGTTQNVDAISPRHDFSLDVLHNLRTAISNKKMVNLVVSRIVPGDRFSSAEKLEKITVSPIKIAVARGSTVLVFSESEKASAETRFISLHRIKSAEITCRNTHAFEFDPKTVLNYFDLRRSKVSYSSTEWLVLRFKTEYAELIENQFSSPVQFRKSEKEGYCIAKTLTAVNTELVGWLLIHGDKVEIVSPNFLGELLKEKSKNYK